MLRVVRELGSGTTFKFEEAKHPLMLIISLIRLVCFDSFDWGGLSLRKILGENINQLKDLARMLCTKTRRSWRTASDCSIGSSY